MSVRIETEHGVFTSNEVTGQTAEQVYQEWLNREQIDICPPKTIEQQIQEMYSKIKSNEEANASLAQYVSDLEIQLMEGGAL